MSGFCPCDPNGGTCPDPTTGMPRCYKSAAAPLPAAPAPTAQAMTHLANIIDFLGTDHPCAKMAENARTALASQPVAALPAEQVPTLPTKDDIWEAICTAITVAEDLMRPMRAPGHTKSMSEANQAINNMLNQLFAALAARQAPNTVPRLDYDLLKLTLEQTQERLRQADEAIAKRDATALRVAQCAGEFARDAARPVVDGAVERDAARYRYLRRTDTDVCIIFPVPPDDSWCPHTEDLDKQVDAAIAQEQAS